MADFLHFETSFLAWLLSVKALGLWDWLVPFVCIKSAQGSTISAPMCLLCLSHKSRERPAKAFSNWKHLTFTSRPGPKKRTSKEAAEIECAKSRENLLTIFIPGSNALSVLQSKTESLAQLRENFFKKIKEGACRIRLSEVIIFFGRRGFELQDTCVS